MERTVEGNVVAYKTVDDTVYLITAINEAAGILAINQLPLNAKADIDHIFQDSGIQKLILFLPEEATSEKKIARNVGFKQEGRLKRATPTGDLLVFGQYR